MLNEVVELIPPYTARKAGNFIFFLYPLCGEAGERVVQQSAPGEFDGAFTSGHPKSYKCVASLDFIETKL